jgi:hypothetical protein
MVDKQQLSALIATFADRREADYYIQELKRAGFTDDEIGVLSPHEHETVVEDDAVAGAITGGMVGAVAGAVATGLIPGIGPVLATGLLTGVLGGAAAGATAGGILGTLVGLGLTEEKAKQFEEEFLAGRTLVAVQAQGRGGEALAIFRHCEKLFHPREKELVQEETHELAAQK